MKRRRRNDSLISPVTSCQGLFKTVHGIFKKIDTAKAGGLMAPGLLMRRLFLRHHLAGFPALCTPDVFGGKVVEHCAPQPLRRDSFKKTGKWSGTAQKQNTLHIPSPDLPASYRCPPRCALFKVLHVYKRQLFFSLPLIGGISMGVPPDHLFLIRGSGCGRNNLPG